ncbi:MAG: (2Fe-2S)-binding protein [Micrococcales bacterium]|nr:MAG: (2Fe-2S)-binding protein [Micrococcales bacterium]PIE26175.1 MAG: (2Fe-2S)-binding protein [Micrococcales bacterium]
MSGTEELEICPSRRQVLRTIGMIGGVTLMPGVLVACSSDTSGGDSVESVAGTTVPAADIAVGTVVLVQTSGTPVLVAQPNEGEFVAYSAECTHQGVPVSPGDNSIVTCAAHGSRFDIADGAAVLTGPATAPLPEVPVAREGDELVLG